MSKHYPGIGRFSDTTSQASSSHTTDSNNPTFMQIDEEALYTSLRERVDYLTAFLDFTIEDVEALNDIVRQRKPALRIASS